MKTVIVQNILARLTGATARFGATVLSVASITITAISLNLSPALLVEMTAALLFLRIGCSLVVRRRQALKTAVAHKNPKQIVREESAISVTFIATCFLMQWPIEPSAALTFVAINFFAQYVRLLVRQRIMSHATASTWQKNSCVENKVIIVGTDDQARRAADSILDSPETGLQIIGFLDYHRSGLWRYRDIPLLGHPDKLERIASGEHLDAVIVAVQAEDTYRSHQLCELAESMGITIVLLPDLYRSKIARVFQNSIAGMPAVVYGAGYDENRWTIVKNLLDRVGAAAGIIVAAPIMLLTAIAIKLESDGPILFRQVRSGRNGRPFGLFKFRTMCADAEEKKSALQSRNEMSGPVFKIRNDPRVTRIGRFLRKSSIDELPQFFNVLRGDMSLVGPRPGLPSEVEKYEPWQRRRLSVKPGVTCTWQVDGRNDIDFDEWMRLDLEYIDNWSLWLDTKLLVRTLPAVLKRDGAS